MICRIQRELPKHLTNGVESSSLMRLVLLLLVAQVSLKRVQEPTSRRTSIELSTSHSLIMPLDASCGRPSLRTIKERSQLTSLSVPWLISLLVTPLDPSRRLARMCSQHSEEPSWMSDHSRCRSSLDLFRFAPRPCQTSGTISRSSPLKSRVMTRDWLLYRPPSTQRKAETTPRKARVKPRKRRSEILGLWQKWRKPTL